MIIETARWVAWALRAGDPVLPDKDPECSKREICLTFLYIIKGGVISTWQTAGMPDESVPKQTATLIVQRRTWLQDLARQYTVFIDGVAVGGLWQFQTGTYQVSQGPHTVRLAIVDTGTSSSDVMKFTAADGGVTIVRTCGRGIGANMALPLALPAGLKALATDSPIQSAFYDGAWIRAKINTWGKAQ
jgi:hypothetical protein